MSCNCINNVNGGTTDESIIKHVFGNVLRLAIPLTLRTIEIVNEKVEVTNTDFIPSSDYPVKVIFTKGNIKIALDAVMQNGNNACIEDLGTIPVGTYDIAVTCNDNNGYPYRFKQKAVLNVVDATIDAGIETPIEYEVTTWYLDAAIYLALKGEDGVGIADITTESSSEIGGMNYITIILTNGTTRTFTILNGSGTVDQAFDVNSPQPIANKVVSAKFNEVDNKIAGLIGDAEYNSTNKCIYFYNKDRSEVIASIDAKQFVKDGMVSNVYISGTTLVVTFNTDAGREAIGVPLQGIFNPNNYYTRSQVEAKITTALSNYTNEHEDAINQKAEILYLTIDSNTPKLSFRGRQLSSSEAYTKLSSYNSNIKIFYQNEIYDLAGYDDNTDNELVFTHSSVHDDDTLVSRTIVFEYTNGNLFAESFTSQGSGSGGGMSASYSNGTITFSGSNQPTYSNGTITF